jgi:hypothetical protein
MRKMKMCASASGGSCLAHLPQQPSSLVLQGERPRPAQQLPHPLAVDGRQAFGIQRASVGQQRTL